jgi:hypothetical protein
MLGAMRKRALAALIAVGLGVAGVAFWVWPDQTDGGISRGGFERIQDGMTQAEVEAILGGPPGDYSAAYVVYGGAMFVIAPHGHGPACREELWKEDGVAVVVYFGPDGTVADKMFACPAPPTPLERLRGWLGL